MKIKCLAPLALLVVALGGDQASAGYAFQFADSGGTAASSFIIDTPPGFVDMRLYLIGTGTEATTLNNTGITDGGVKLTFSGGPFNVSTVTPNTGQFAGFNNSSTTATSATLNVHNDAAVTGSSGRIFLGTFRFQGLTAGSELVVTADPDPTAGFDDNVLGNGTAIDSLIANSSAAITVNAVPEPGTFLLAGLFAICAVTVGIRRLRSARTVALA